MEIRVDENGSLRLESNAPLSKKVSDKMTKRLENKKATLDQMMKDYEAGKYNQIFEKA